MNITRFERLSKAMANKRANRQESPVASPEAAPGTNEKIEILFVQTYQSGTIEPIEGNDSRYSLTLERGTGQTVYFSARPDRIVGATETPQFLEGLGFPPDNPPNAALVVETEPGETDVAVVELFTPLYDPVSQSVTYEVEVLKNWQRELDLELTEAPTDLATLAPSFRAASLFIDGLDDCPGSDHPMQCVTRTGGQIVAGTIDGVELGGWCQNWQSPFGCYPCVPSAGMGVEYGPRTKVEYWTDICNERFEECQSALFPDGNFAGCYIDPRCYFGFDGLCAKSA